MMRGIFRNVGKALGLVKDPPPVPTKQVIETPFQAAYQALLNRHEETVATLTATPSNRRARRWREIRANRLAMQKESRRRNRVA